MNALYLAALVLLSAQAVKLLVRRFTASGALPLGPFGAVRMVAGQLWLRRRGSQFGVVEIWCLWTAAAVPLVVMSILLPSTAAYVGLLLGGSLSQGLESSKYAEVSDYVCLRFWPSFNLADLAIAAGAVGMFGEALITIRTTMF